MLKVLENKNTMLHTALRANAVFCDLSGLGIVFGAKPLTAFLGLGNPGVLVGLGVGLVAWSLLLYWGSVQGEVPRWLAWLAIDGDLAWVVGSVIVVLLPGLSLTGAGKWATAITADVVLLFAIWQFYALRRA
jgi:hypothetical protein